MEQANNGWYNVKKITKKVWLIEDKGVNLYLLEGSKKALLIDPGWGIGKLSALIPTLTKLPLIVLNTHAHIDHVSGNFQFEDIYIHENDLQLLGLSFEKHVREKVVQRFTQSEDKLPPEFSEEEWVNATFDSFIPFKGQKFFDLGDRAIDIIEMPGHTPGCVCVLDNAKRLLFTGDSVVEGRILMHFEYSLPLHIYLDGLSRLICIMDKIDYIMPSHGTVPMKPSVLLELKDGIEKILSGEIKGEPIETQHGSGLLCNFGRLSLLYREDNL